MNEVNRTTVDKLIELETDFMKRWAQQLGLVCGLVVEVGNYLDRKEDYDNSDGGTVFKISDLSYPLKDRGEKLLKAVDVLFGMTKTANNYAAKHKLSPVLLLSNNKETAVKILRAYGEDRGDILLEKDFLNMF